MKKGINAKIKSYIFECVLRGKSGKKKIISLFSLLLTSRSWQRFFNLLFSFFLIYHWPRMYSTHAGNSFGHSLIPSITKQKDPKIFAKQLGSTFIPRRAMQASCNPLGLTLCFQKMQKWWVWNKVDITNVILRSIFSMRRKNAGNIAASITQNLCATKISLKLDWIL